MFPVVFVAPFFAETTLRFIGAAAGLDGVRLGLVSQDPLEKLPAGVRGLLAAHRRIDDGLDPRGIARAVEALAGEIGSLRSVGGRRSRIDATLEDETGIANVIVWPPIFERYRRIVLGARLLQVDGEVQREGIVIHIIAKHLIDQTPLFADLAEPAAIAGKQPIPVVSRNFH